MIHLFHMKRLYGILYLSIAIFLLKATACAAATPEGFSPDTGILIPQIRGQLNNEAGFVFQNPAGLSSVESKQVLMQSGSDYLGYIPLSLAITFPMEKGGLGIGISSLSAQDGYVVPNTSSPDDRPASAGTFTHAFRKFTVGYGSPLVPDLLDLGASVSILQQELYKNSATAFSADVGIFWYRNNYWIGCRSRNLLSTGYQWNTGIREALPFDLLLELGAEFGTTQVGAEFGFKNTRFWGQLPLNPMFSITGDMTMLGTTTPTRYSIGAAMQLGDMMVSYSRNTAVNSEFGIQQDLIGITFLVK